MAICNKGFIMETKTCGVSCLQCEHYDTRTRVQRLKDEAIKCEGEFRKQLEIDLKTYATPKKGCYDCKYCLDEGYGCSAYCRATKLHLSEMEGHISKVCPFWKNRKNKRD